MRVGLFTNNYLPFRGGVTTAVETLRQGLEGLGHRVWVFAPAAAPPHPDPPFVFRYPSIPAPTYPGFSLPVPVSPRLGRLARALALDVVHVHHPFLLGVTGRRLARRQGRPLVFTYHTRYEKYAHYVPLPLRLVEDAAVRLSTRFAARADAVIAPSARIRDDLRRRGVRTPIAVVPTGVDLTRFRPGDQRRARIALGVPDDGPVVLYVGRLDREKSVERVLLGFERAASTLPAARLLIVGQGTEGQHLRRLAAALPVGERIRFLGVRAHPALVQCYQAADVFLFASETETQGLVLAEAAACGLPAVAVSAPGCDEAIRDGETGILTKNDPATLGDAVVGLLLDSERRRWMGHRAREVAEGAFDVRLQIARTLEVYAKVASGRAGAKRPWRS